MLLTLKTKLYYGYYLTKNQCIRLLAASTRVRSASTLFHKRSPFMNRSPERQTHTNLITPLCLEGLRHIHFSFSYTLYTI
jgi:hypothetical protein